MPWDIKQNFESCNGYAVVKRGTTEIEGCHSTKEAAQSQMSALYASETEKETMTSNNVPNRNPDYIDEEEGVKKNSEDLHMMLKTVDEIIEDINKAESVRVGQMVSWNSSGGRAEGKVIRVIRSGKFKVPNTSFEITGTEEEPAAAIRLYRDGKPTETVVGHKVKTLTIKKNVDDPYQENKEAVPGADKFTTEQEALDRAEEIGCEGTHSIDEDGETIYMPCSTHAIYDSIVNDDESDLGKAESVRVGQMVSWNSSGGRAQGKVTRIIRNGKYNVPGSDFTITGTEDDPAVAIRLYRNGKPTDTMVGHKMKTLRAMPNKSYHKDDMNKINISDIDLKPTESIANNARRGLELRSQYGRGGTSVGVARARDLSNRKTLSPETVTRMYSFFSRHEVDKKAKGFNSGEEGYPSNGRIAWMLWGGDAGFSWAKSKWSQIQRARMSKEESAENSLTSVFLDNVPREARRTSRKYSEVYFKGLTEENK